MIAGLCHGQLPAITQSLYVRFIFIFEEPDQNKIGKIVGLHVCNCVPTSFCYNLHRNDYSLNAYLYS
jgi:hypothetical protein